MSLLEHPIGRLAITHPGATLLFHEHGIDICWGGRLTLREAADLLSDMHQEMESHMQKEEQVLFPLLRRGMGAMAGGPIAVMRQEHDDHGAALARLLRLTDDITPPQDACITWRALYAGLREFRDALMQHIHLENNLLFERSA